MLLEATPATTQTIIREVSADLETPISVYMKLRGQGPSFLLESVEGGERIARYSFIGVQPRAQYIIRGNEIEIVASESARTITLAENVDPTYFLQEEMSRFKSPALAPGASVNPQMGMPRFIGGLVGYMGYESVRYFEPTLKPSMKRRAERSEQTGERSRSVPDGIYLLADTVIAFDHARRSLSLITNVLDGDIESANHKLDEIESRINQPLPPVQHRIVQTSKTRSNMTQGKYEDMVRDAKEHIVAGDIFQVVLSQRFSRETNVEPFDV